MNVQKRFEKIVDDLYGVNQYLAAELIRMGYPRLDPNVKTAQVRWDKDKKKSVFEFNPDFFNSLTDEELAFACAHEAFHFFSCHVLLIRDEFEKLERRGATDEEKNKFFKKFLIGSDCVVNDSLTIIYGLPKLFDGTIPDKPRAIYGKDIIKVDCHDLTVTDVMKLIPDDHEAIKQFDDHESWKSFLNADGSVNKDFLDKIKKFVKSKLENSSLSDKEMAMVEKAKESLEKLGVQAGKEDVGGRRDISGLGRDSINWSRIINALVETKSIEETWARPNKKLSAIYPDAMLPSWNFKEKEQIFIAIDSSGSIDYEALSLFVRLVKNTPKHYELKAISFDTQCYPYDVKSDEKPKGGGGTDFAIIESYIQKNLKKYPRAVLVLTDGQGTPVSPKYPARWGWLLYGSSSEAYCGDMKRFYIDKIKDNR